MRRPFAGALLIAALSGCVSTPDAGCAAGEQAAVSETIYFGMARPTGGAVSQEEWATFLRDEVTPRFPAGLTVWPAAGQWRGNDGQVVREDSYVLNLIHPGDAVAERSVLAIVSRYKQQFAQEAVLRVRSGACTSL
jgi:hypothetical protein